MAKSAKKKVQFFEVCDENGQQFEGPLRWEDALAKLSRQSVGQRLHQIRGVPHWGRTYTHNERDHFVLARMREDGVSIFDIEKDEFIDQSSQAAVPFVEISVVSLLPDRNIFGFVRGSNAASHVVGVSDWINMHQMFAKPITVVPLLSKRTRQKIEAATEVKVLNVAFTEELSAATAVRQAGGLSSAVGTLVEDLGPADIELVIRRKGRLKDRDYDFRRRLAEMMKLVAARPFSKASAEIVIQDDEGRPSVEPINFLNDVLARKMDVQVTDQEGNPVRIPSAIEAIEKAAQKLQDDLDQ